MIPFNEAYLAAKKDGRLQLSEARAMGLYNCAAQTTVDGDFWECGVYRGGSAKLILSANPRRLLLFDTFAGFENVSAADAPGVVNGRMFYSDDAAKEVSDFLNSDFISIHKGPIPTSFIGLQNSKIAFAHVDLDLYLPTRDALQFIWKRAVNGGVIVVDDYGDPDWPGVKKAVDEIVGQAPILVENTQAVICL